MVRGSENSSQNTAPVACGDEVGAGDGGGVGVEGGGAGVSSDRGSIFPNRLDRRLKLRSDIAKPPKNTAPGQPGHPVNDKFERDLP